MEQLNKHQLILLALLVSFITSIATGIVTVALMDQAPQSVSQTINRVVERTIQQVVSPATTTVNTVNTIKETVVVNEDDQVVNTISKNSGSLIRIFRTNTDIISGTDAMTFVGIGIVVSDDNIIATDNSLISDGGKYFTSLADGKLRDLNILRASSGEQIALLKIIADATSTMSLSKTILSQNDIKLGQSVVYIGGQTKNSVAVGIVSSLGTKDITVNASNSAATTTKTVVSSIETTFSSNNLISGGPILNLSGEIVGIKGTFLDSARTDLFVPVSSIQSVLSSYQDSQKKTQ
jgi:S1-C subfamily serine protease